MDELYFFRREFPVIARWYYFNHAAVSPLPTRARERMEKHLAETNLNGAVHFREWEETVEKTRALAARLLNCSASEIAFIKNTSEGINFVARGIDWKEGDNIIVPEIEFPANRYPWMNLKDEGVEVRFIPGGKITAGDIANVIDARTRLVAISFVQYQNGFRAPLAGISKLCREKGILLTVDAIQGLGAIKLDVKETPIDFLSADSHKWLLGPEGIGIFYCAKRVLDRIKVRFLGWMSVQDYFNFSSFDIRLHKNARRFECGTPNRAGIIGLSASLELILEAGIERIERKILTLTDWLVDELNERGYQMVSPRGEGEKSGIVSFKSPKHKSDEIVSLLREHKVIVSGRGGLIRVSPHFYNTESDLSELLLNLPKL
jgi:cysteine desulfurase/selenocysteine lyase